MNKIAKYAKMLWAMLTHDKSNVKTYYVLVSKNQYVDGTEDNATFVGGYLFETRAEAERHALDVREYNKSVYPIGIEEFKTDLLVTVAKFDYRRCETHPQPTVTFK